MLDLTELKKAEEKATPGEWSAGIDWSHSTREQRLNDERFMILARNLCREMIEEIERLREGRMEIAPLPRSTPENITIDQRFVFEKEIRKLRAELAKAREAIAYAAGPTRDVKEPMLREALRSIDESGLLK